MTENNVYTGSTPLDPSENGGVTPRPVVTPPISTQFTNLSVSSTPKVLFTADCTGSEGFYFNITNVTGGTVTFSMYLNDSFKTSKPVSSSTSFTLGAGTGTNVCMISGTNNAVVSGSVKQEG